MNTLLGNITKAGITNALNTVFPDRDVFDNKLLYDYETDFTEVITDKVGFVGFEIQTAKRSDIAIVLNKISLSFDGNQSVKLLLFNSQSKKLITSKTIAVLKDVNTYTALDWVCGAITAQGGIWYIGYLNTGFTAHAYSYVYGNSNVRNQFNSAVFRPIYVAGHNSETLFDINDVEYVEDGFGVNLDISIVKDISSLILNNKDKFAKAIQLGTAIQCIKEMQTSNRRNADERVISVNGVKTVIDSPETANLYFAYDAEIKRLKLWFEDRDIESYTLR
jgi:hypothetical protein